MMYNDKNVLTSSSKSVFYFLYKFSRFCLSCNFYHKIIRIGFRSDVRFPNTHQIPCLKFSVDYKSCSDVLQVYYHCKFIFGLQIIKSTYLYLWWLHITGRAALVALYTWHIIDYYVVICGLKNGTFVDIYQYKKRYLKTIH